MHLMWDNLKQRHSKKKTNHDWNKRERSRENREKSKTKQDKSFMLANEGGNSFEMRLVPSYLSSLKTSRFDRIAKHTHKNAVENVNVVVGVVIICVRDRQNQTVEKKKERKKRAPFNFLFKHIQCLFVWIIWNTKLKNGLFSHLSCHYFFLICFQTNFNWSFSVSFTKNSHLISLFFLVSLRLQRFYLFVCVFSPRCHFVMQFVSFFGFSFSFASVIVVVAVKCFIWNPSEVFTNCFFILSFFSLLLYRTALNERKI